MFHYLRDKSAFGYGTQARTNLPWSRICGSMVLLACPNSPNNISIISNETGDFWQGDWYSSHIPQNVTDLFQSGLSTMDKSVSSVFDIQWRSYSWSQPDDQEGALPIDNGSCNRLPDLAYYSVLLASALPYMSHYLWLTRLLSAKPTTFCPIFHVFIPLDFHRFTIKLLGQFPHTAKLTYTLPQRKCL